MNFKSPYLHELNSKNETNRLNGTEEPLEEDENKYKIYNITGGIFSLKVKDFADFCVQWIGVPNKPSLTMDLSSTITHSLILDFDSKKSLTAERITNSLNLIECVLKATLLPNVSHFTQIFALRSGGNGIHVHLPEFKIGYDDYIIFCQSLQQQFKQTTLYDEGFKLDILTNAMLAGAAKPNCNPYVPYRLVYVDESNQFSLDIFKLKEENLNIIKKKIAKRKNNVNSIFRHLLNFNPREIAKKLNIYMMPVVVDVFTHTLSYDTNVGKLSNSLPDWQDVATFVSKKFNETGFLRKSKKLMFNSANSSKAYHYLKLNARTIKDFKSNNRAITTWYESFKENGLGNVSNKDVPEIFFNLHEILQFEHASLSRNRNPIKTIMQFNEGYYFLPVFYSLCQYYKMDSRSMVEILRSMLDDSFHGLLDKIKKIDPKVIEYETKNITINTLHFCANNLDHVRPRKHRQKLKSIVENNMRSILSVTTEEQMTDLIRSIQDRHLPIRVLKLKNALKRALRYIWNAIDETWQGIPQGETSDHVHNLFTLIKQYVKEYHASGGIGGPDDDLLNKFNIYSVVATIHSDTSMERKEIQMDSHKWFLRLQDGVLDLLTGHVGAVVPEFFLSDRKINVGFSRSEMMTLCNKTPRYTELYEKLTEKRFFYKYLEYLYLDVKEDLWETLIHMLPDCKGDDLSESILHFYMNLCKCTCFDYDMFMYILDILASVYIGTNYERKFFVLKGITRNGKSKLFELMGQVLGSYYHSIQSENLSPGHSSNNAMPELASTLFCCRMVAIEELGKKIDENRVKQITGDNNVTFRNMYEQNSGGIPTAKIFASTNNYPECIASEAFKDRVVAIPFDAEFTDTAPKLTSEQVVNNTYKKQTAITEPSLKGCFFILYYHLKKCINSEDGFLHYRTQPEYVIEFTNDYLHHADVYVQFKLHMDVQMIPDTMTSMNDLKSAVRQYLKFTKNTSIPESNLVLSFEKEFGHLRRQDISLKDDFSNYVSIADQEDEKEPPLKKEKKDDSILIYFEGIVIKNLKRTSLDG